MKVLQPDFYNSSLADFSREDPARVFGVIQTTNNNDLKQQQSSAWEVEIRHLQSISRNLGTGWISFEYNIPRLGRRIDVALASHGIVFVLEFKVEAERILKEDEAQVWDYALDLKNFHSTSNGRTIVPFLIGTNCQNLSAIKFESAADSVYQPIIVNEDGLADAIRQAVVVCGGPDFDYSAWRRGVYSPTPTIIEAARTLYNTHRVEDIRRADATAKNLSNTCAAVERVIADAKANKKKVLCFVTGVPGAGKTLVGLTIATKRAKPADGEAINDLAVYLSGNAPLVAILCEALTRDAVVREKAIGHSVTKKDLASQVHQFIQIVHHFSDACLIGIRKEGDELVPDENYWMTRAKDNEYWVPPEHVAIFDEAQRAWNKPMLVDFMARKKHFPDFPYSEPEFLISCMDRRKDWAVVLCLVGEGQEINRGEMGICGWVDAILKKFPHWTACISPEMSDLRFGATEGLTDLRYQGRLIENEDLHLSVSLRSFRTEKLASFVQAVLDRDVPVANSVYSQLDRYPICLTRDIEKAKRWLRARARGSERYGMIVSSQAYRLKPLAIDVRVKANPVLWFLNDSDDIRSSFYLEDVVTEFDIQGLEIDWAAVVWDGDFRYGPTGWQHFAFKGDKWQHINKSETQSYQTNAYRVLMTRARQGMILVVPRGSDTDSTRKPEFYDSTYVYLKSIGITEI